MKHSVKASLVLVIVSLAPGLTVAAEEAEEPVTAALSPETRGVLIREMQAIAGAMGDIHRALVTGDHETVGEQARKIHDSFVLAQALSDAQRKEIGTKLPGEFVAADRAFHGLAAKLAEAAKQGDPDVERFWFQEMTRACQGCHTDFAAGRFPGLANGSGSGH